MLSVNDVSDADYYLRTSGSGCGGGAGSGGSAAEYELDAIAAGEPPGQWLYPYRNDLGVAGEIHAEGPSGEAFRTVLNHLQHPVTGEQLGRAPQRFASVEARVEKFKRKHPDATAEQIAQTRVRAESHRSHAVHAWDLTFSAQKSISVLHAAYEREGRHDDASQVTAAMRAGIDAAMRMAADEFGVTRRGAAGPDIDGTTTMRHVREPNLQSAIFVHHTSRERDPQLHAHVMVLNRLLSEDGQWRALFASGLLKSKHQLDAVFQRVMEAELAQRLGVRLAMRPDGVAREVVGVSPQVRDLFSARTRELSEEAQRLVDQYTALYGRPSRLVQWRIQQRATLASRRAKPKQAPTREDDIARWDREVAAEFREGLAAVLEEVDLAATRPSAETDFDPDVVIAQALADLTERKASFNRSHLMHAISQHLPDVLAVEPDRVPGLLCELTDAAQHHQQVVSLAAPAPVPVPASLVDPQTGESVFEPPRGGRFTTRTHLSREDWLVGLLNRRGAPVLTEESAHRVLAGRGLSNEQMDVAVAILTSDLTVQVVNAAAGTGKSRLMAALSDASNDMWGQGLTGFTASQNAAEVLAREGVHRAHNISAFLTYRERERRGEATDTERVRFAVPRDATVVVDEASMVSTPQAVALTQELLDVGVGRVVFIGDTAQVDAVDAGGGFALLAQERQPHTLTQVRRFTNEWERDASTRLRDGDLEVLTQYDARARIRGGGPPEDVERAAVDAFVTDHLSGEEPVLVVGAGEKAAQLSSQIRQRLVAAGRVRPDGVTLHDRTAAGVGDLVQTRMNNRGLGVVNREVWRVEEVDPLGGGITVARAERDERDQRVWGARVTLPPDYVRDHVELAYAATVEAVQGRTTDTGHLLVDDMMGRSRAYPGLTRGRQRNTAWVPVERPARRHRESDAEYEARIPSPMSAMVAALEREDHTEAARTVIKAEQERATNLGHLGPQWAQLVAEHRGADHRQVLREVVGTDRHALFADLSLEGLLHLMRSAEAHGYDVRAALEEAYGDARLEGARSPASVLYARLDRTLNGACPGTAPRAGSYRERTPAGDGEEISYAREVAGVMDARVEALGERAEVEPPGWAVALLGPVPADVVERGAWREKVAVVAGYREQYGWQNTIDPVGRAPSRAEPERRWAWLRASAALGVDAERDVVSASDGELANRVLAWRRTQEWLPRNVDDDLRETELAAGEARRLVVEARARGEDPSGAVRELREMEARAGRLEQVASARARGVEHTAPERERAQEALVEIGRRVRRDQVVMDREAARAAAADRAAREASDRAARDEARVHEAVGERFNAAWVPGAPLFGSPRWAELPDDAPAKRASLFNAALGWWRAGSPRDEAELNERLETHGVDRVPEQHLSHRGLERVRAGVDEVEARREEPSGEPEVLAEVHRVTGRDMVGEAPEFGSVGYVDADDEQRGKAETRAARRWFGSGDDLDERARRAEVAEERAAAQAVSRDVRAEREHRLDNRSHREVAKTRGEDPPPAREPIQVEAPVEPDRAERVDTSWTRPPEPTAEREPEPEPGPGPEPERDELAEQVARAREAVARMDREDETREQVPEPRHTEALEHDAPEL